MKATVLLCVSAAFWTAIFWLFPWQYVLAVVSLGLLAAMAASGSVSDDDAS